MNSRYPRTVFYRYLDLRSVLVAAGFIAGIVEETITYKDLFSPLMFIIQGNMLFKSFKEIKKDSLHRWILQKILMKKKCIAVRAWNVIRHIAAFKTQAVVIKTRASNRNRYQNEILMDQKPELNLNCFFNSENYRN